MEGTVYPGYFHLPLPINDKNIAKDAVVERKLIDIEQDLKTRLDRPEELAIHNVLGLLKYYLKRYNGALNNFCAILKKDPDNINALANIQYVLKELHRNEEAKSFNGQLELINGHPTGGTDGAPATDTHQQRIIRARARCLAEQAYVYACDIHTDEACNERYQESNDIFGRALQYAGDLVETSERDFWEFIMAKNAHKLFTKFSYGDNYKKANDYLDTVVHLFYKITQRNPGDSEYQWESWRHLADLCRKIKTSKHFTYSHIEPRELRNFIHDPEECMKNAMAISPNNPRLLARYANFVYSLKRDTCTTRALELLDESIRIDDSDYNFYAFSTRGMINLKSYQWSLRKSNEDGSRFFPPKPRMLYTAISDLEKAIKFRNTSWDLLNLATVYHHLAKCNTEASNETPRWYLERELEYLKRAEDCKDPSDRQMHLYRTLGRCKFDLGEYSESIDYFKKAIRLESASSQYTGYFYEMFCSYLSLLRSDNTILEEMARSTRKAISKYGRSSLVKYCFSPKLRAEYNSELQVLTDYCEKIPDNEDLLLLLRSEELASPLARPVRQGGTLQYPWENSVQLPYVQKKRADTESSGNLTIRSDALPQMLYPPGTQRDTVSTALLRTLDERSDAPEDEEGLLVSGFEGIKISKPSAEKVSQPGPQVSSSEGQNLSFCYDFYVMHAETDDNWVHDKLLHELENCRKLRGCTYTRDCPLGSLVYKANLELMQQSANILLILSADFTEKCQYLSQQALKLRDSGYNIIPIKRDVSRVPDELRVLKCFEASGERVEWDKLANSIKRQVTRCSTASGISTE